MLKRKRELWKEKSSIKDPKSDDAVQKTKKEKPECSSNPDDWRPGDGPHPSD